MKNAKKGVRRRFTKNIIKHTKKYGVKLKPLKWQISTVVLGLLLIFSIFTGGLIPIKTTGLTEQAIEDKLIQFINQNVLQGQGTVTLKNIEESNNLYNIQLNINGQDFDSYVTKDGKFLFPQVIDLNEAPRDVQEQPTQDMPKTATPDVKLFTMTFCPYGDQAEEAMYPVAELLKNKANIEPHYVIYSDYQGGGPQYCLDAENKYCSMHGIQELNQGVRELCVYKYQKDKFWEFVMKVNEKCSAQNVDSCWEAIAKEQGINTEEIKSCQKDEAMDLLKKEVELNEKYGVRGSPVLVINDVTYDGARTPEAYKAAICSAFTEEPEICSETLDENQAPNPSGGCG